MARQTREFMVTSELIIVKKAFPWLWHFPMHFAKNARASHKRRTIISAMKKVFQFCKKTNRLLRISKLFDYIWGYRGRKGGWCQNIIFLDISYLKNLGYGWVYFLQTWKISLYCSDMDVQIWDCRDAGVMYRKSHITVKKMTLKLASKP